MHTEAIKKYMTDRHITYKISVWNTNNKIYWLEKFYDGNLIGCHQIFDIDVLFDCLKNQKVYDNIHGC